MIVLSRYLQEKGIAVSELRVFWIVCHWLVLLAEALWNFAPTEVLAMRAKYPILKSWRSILNRLSGERV